MKGAGSNNTKDVKGGKQAISRQRQKKIKGWSKRIEYRRKKKNNKNRKDKD